MSSKSLHTLILTATAVIGLGSITLGTSMLDRFVFRSALIYPATDPDAASSDVPHYIRHAPFRSPNDIWSFEFD